MRPFLTLLLILSLASLTAQNWGSRKQVRGNGDQITQKRDVSGFDGLKVCCSIDVELSRGPFSVEVRAESNLQEFIETRVSGGRLRVGYKSGTSIRESMPVKVFVTMPEISYLGASSSSSIDGDDEFNGDDLEIDVSSSAHIEVKFSGDNIDVDGSSSGKVMLEGKADKIDIDCSSSAKIRAGGLKVRTAVAEASSGSGITVNVSTDLDAKANSGASVRYIGEPTRVNSNTSSGGSVRRKN